MRISFAEDNFMLSPELVAAFGPIAPGIPD